MEAHLIATWRIGPPAPRALSWATRGLQLTTLLMIMVWVFGYLGGVRLTPRPLPAPPGGGASANETSGIFNLHPILMTLAFVVVMGEALLAYKAPALRTGDRAQRKSYHIALQAAALVLAAAGVVAAVQSHNLKRPDPIPNLYSVHSFLGGTVLSLFIVQAAVGVSAYIYPRWHWAHRAALGPVHAALGMAVFGGGAAAVATGVQEKATFLQLMAKPGLRSAAMWVPAVLVVLVLLSSAAVLYHHAPSAARRRQDSEASGTGGGYAEASAFDATPLQLERLG